jgi:hypothetical protein
MKLVSAAFIVTVHKHDFGPDLVLFPALEMLLGSSLVRDTEFQDRVVAETRALLSTIQA